MYYAKGFKTGKVYASSNNEQEVLDYIKTMTIPFSEKINVIEVKDTKEFRVVFFHDPMNRERNYQTVMRLRVSNDMKLTDVLLSRALERWKRALIAPIVTLKDHKSRQVSFVLDTQVEIAVENHVRRPLGYRTKHFSSELGASKNVKLFKFSKAQAEEFYEILKQESLLLE